MHLTVTEGKCEFDIAMVRVCAVCSQCEVHLLCDLDGDAMSVSQLSVSLPPSLSFLAQIEEVDCSSALLALVNNPLPISPSPSPLCVCVSNGH